MPRIHVRISVTSFLIGEKLQFHLYIICNRKKYRTWVDNFVLITELRIDKRITVCFRLILTRYWLINNCKCSWRKSELRSSLFVGSVKIRLTRMLHLTRVQKHTNVLKQCSAIQSVNSFRKKVSYACIDRERLEVRDLTDDISNG